MRNLDALKEATIQRDLITNIKNSQPSLFGREKLELVTNYKDLRKYRQGNTMREDS